MKWREAVLWALAAVLCIACAVAAVVEVPAFHLDIDLRASSVAESEVSLPASSALININEASAAELKHLITLTREHGLPAVFTESSGSVSAAGVIAAETGADIFELDMAMSGDSYFAAMYRNIDTIKEALG